MTSEIKQSQRLNNENVKQYHQLSNNIYIQNEEDYNKREYNLANRNPLLNGIKDHHSSSISSSSTGGGGSGSGNDYIERDINYCEIYFLSSPKRIQNNTTDNLQYTVVSNSIPYDKSSNTKSSISSTIATTITTTTTANTITTPNIDWLSSSTATPNLITKKVLNKKMDDCTLENSNNVFTSYNTRFNDSNLDNFDTRSHYSDSAATITNSIFQQMIATNATSTGINAGRSIIDATATKSRNNNVTFSNCTEERMHLNRGSLRRNKGRSIQSLCSCNNADTEIIPNPNRPLYQYNVDRKNKIHTYTCEQNAQILMRLEREKRKISRIDKQVRFSYYFFRFY